MFQLFIDFLARALCMRGEALPYGKDDEAFVYKDPAKDGYKSGRRCRRIRMPQMKYNKFQMHDLSESPPVVANQNHTTTPLTSQPPTEMTSSSPSTMTNVTNGLMTDWVGGETAPDRGIGGMTDNGGPETSTDSGHWTRTMEHEVREIRRYLHTMLKRLQHKEELTKIAVEWRVVALVLDRIFFFMYVTAIIVSLVTIFPKTY